jgi:hypothetical protein
VVVLSPTAAGFDSSDLVDALLEIDLVDGSTEEEAAATTIGRVLNETAGATTEDGACPAESFC